MQSLHNQTLLPGAHLDHLSVVIRRSLRMLSLLYGQHYHGGDDQEQEVNQEDMALNVG